MSSATLDTLPAELLHEIIVMTNRRRAPFDHKSNRTLPRLARVSKAFRAATVYVLYSDVYISSEEDDRILWKTRAFRRTVTTNAYLASLVRSIHFSSLYYSRGETRTLAQAIETCTNLEGVEIWGWNGYELDELKDAIQSKKGMKNVILSRRGISDIECDHFCTLEGFMNMLQGWPMLERVLIHNDTIEWAEFEDTDDENKSVSDASDHPPPGEEDFDEDTRAQRKAMRQEYFDSVKALPRLSVTPNACPAFTHLDFRSDILQSRHIIALSRFAPNLSYIHIRGDTCGFEIHDPEALGSALKNWSKSLKTLKVHFYDNEEDGHGATRKGDWTLNVGEELAGMEALKYMRLSSAYVQPEALQKGFATLEKLKYRVWDKELGRFVKVFKAASALPSLKWLKIRMRTKDDEGSRKKAFAPTVWKDLQKICRKKGVYLDEDDNSCDTEDAELGFHHNGPRYELDDLSMYENEDEEGYPWDGEEDEDDDWTDEGGPEDGSDDEDELPELE